MLVSIDFSSSPILWGSCGEIHGFDYI
uniref:Uncharacterized protein n=1 Tax=Rhizophora mucronata TaxID=61149 RepID=A0A2P2PS49_RHIMU